MKTSFHLWKTIKSKIIILVNSLGFLRVPKLHKDLLRFNYFIIQTYYLQTLPAILLMPESLAIFLLTRIFPWNVYQITRWIPDMSNIQKRKTKFIDLRTRTHPFQN